jgi:CO/xanthine dehydrogenase Mo-binding subunit
MPGVLRVLTGAEPHSASCCRRAVIAAEQAAESAAHHPDLQQPTLAVGKVRHVGEAVAVVVAETAIRLRMPPAVGC